MVTSNAIQRTFMIRLDSSQGTAFTVDRAGRQYLVTARHVLDGIAQTGVIDIWYEDQWTPLAVTVVGTGQGQRDVAVLAASVQLSPAHPLELSSAHIFYSQPVYFLGFPHGFHTGSEEINRGLPIPFVKSGIVSALEAGDIKRVYIDAHANEGFSGGPVVYHPRRGSAEPNELRVAGVVTGYVSWTREVLDADGRASGRVMENTGIVVATDAQHVIDLIDANPIGCVVRTDQ